MEKIMIEWRIYKLLRAVLPMQIGRLKPLNDAIYFRLFWSAVHVSTGYDMIQTLLFVCPEKDRFLENN